MTNTFHFTCWWELSDFIKTWLKLTHRFDGLSSSSRVCPETVAESRSTSDHTFHASNANLTANKPLKPTTAVATQKQAVLNELVILMSVDNYSFFTSAWLCDKSASASDTCETQNQNMPETDFSQLCHIPGREPLGWIMHIFKHPLIAPRILESLTPIKQTPPLASPLLYPFMSSLC